MKQLTRSLLFIVAGSSLLFTSCGSANNNDKKEGANDSVSTPYPKIELALVANSPEFKDAQLQVKGVKSTIVEGSDSVKLSFEFDVKNYELKNQTLDAEGKMCNNSAKGQHIHFILDNQPYVALYEPKYEVVVPIKSEHYVMAFLSRSYHESIKSKGAAQLYHFSVNEKGQLTKLAVPATPMIFYSRPKGDYIGKDTANVLLDFYVWNTTLATDSNKVKAEISNPAIPNHDTAIVITDWKPYFIHNLGTGKSKITLTLVDKDGKPLTGDNATVSRNFQLAAEEPLKK